MAETVTTVMRTLGVLAVAAFVACCGGAQRPDLADLPVPNVARLHMAPVGGDGPPRFGCTAFKVDDGLVGTAGHCCEEDTVYSLGEGGPEAEVLVDDDTADVCVMRGRMSGASIPLALRDPAVGEPVYTMGFPLGTQVISAGHWSGRDVQDDGTWGVASIVVRGGSSGSPVLNRDGELAGILVATYRGGDSIAFIATIENVRLAVYRARARLAAGD